MERRDDLQHVLMPNQQEENLPESDDWRMEERPAMEVVVGQGSVEGEFVEVDDIGQVDHVIELGQHHEYEDGFPSLLPIRDGAPLLTLNLPDLISKSIPFANGEKMIICFNKKCSRQIAFAGYLYSISGYLEENSWNLWKCVNENCDGSVRTSPNCLELRVRTEHISSCVPDDAQIRLRIAIYDLRLMAEFTDLSLQLLFAGNESRMKADNGDIAHLMPSFETLRTTLEDHRVNKIYRKRFEMQTLKDKQRKYHMTPDEILYAESTACAIRFKRTKLFPPSMCADCGEEFTSTIIPSQDQLISHIDMHHDKHAIIERYTFKEANLFEQWIRDLGVYSKYRMKKMGLADEHMYFLCSLDDRVSRTGQGRATKHQQQNVHCTAFIRVYDWRLVMQREVQETVVDYCLDHCFHKEMHDADLASNAHIYEVYSPEVFLREVGERKARTQKMMSDQNSFQRIKRDVVRSNGFSVSNRGRSCFGSRALAPPIAAQLAGGVANPVVDSFYTETDFVSNDSPDVSSLFRASRRFRPPKTVEPSQGRSYITNRDFFKDAPTYSLVLKAEEACESLVNRLQHCSSSRQATRYKHRIDELLRAAVNDPEFGAQGSPEPDMTTAGTSVYRSMQYTMPTPGTSVRPVASNIMRKPTKRPAKVTNANKSNDEFDFDLKDELDEESSPPQENSPKVPRRGRPRKNESFTPVKKVRHDSTTSVATCVSESRSGRQRKTPARLHD